MAQTHVYLTSPYFSPGTVVDRALQAAARRGVDARLLVPRRSDPPVAGWATRAAYAHLLSAGVRVYEYLPRQLHAKTSVIDAAWSIVGSANLDYRSLFINQELVLIARDRTLAEQLQAQYLGDLAEAAEITRRGTAAACARVAWRRLAGPRDDCCSCRNRSTHASRDRASRSELPSDCLRPARPPASSHCKRANVRIPVMLSVEPRL
jgi:cardiolipin synthase